MNFSVLFTTLVALCVVASAAPATAPDMAKRLGLDLLEDESSEAARRGIDIDQADEEPAKRGIDLLENDEESSKRGIELLENDDGEAAKRDYAAWK